MAYATGRISVGDMVGVGLCLNVVGVVVVLLALHTLGDAVFGLGELPEWANGTAVGHAH